MAALKIHVPEGHYTISARFSPAELHEIDLELVDSPDNAEVIVTALVEECLPFAAKYRAEKKYLIWCDEPLWSSVFIKANLRRNEYEVTGVGRVVIDAMNCFTGDIFFNNYHFLSKQYCLDLDSFYKNSGGFTKERFALSGGRIVVFASYRNDTMWNYEFDNGVKGLCTERSRVALEGALFGHIDVYGKDWPLAIANREPLVKCENEFMEKIQVQKNYNFALCFENTLSNYYVTEKIWQAILSDTLPIYYAGPKHTIYQDFPKESFLDYCDFKCPNELFDRVKQMTLTEYENRLGLCRDALKRSIEFSDEGKVSRQLQLIALRQRIMKLS